MGLIFTEWLNANENRAYPLHDNAGRRAGTSLLPNDLLADCQIWLPRSLGRYVCLSSASVSPKLVTLTFVASQEHPQCGSPDGSFTPIAVLSLLRPVVRFKPYALRPLAPGVGGWINLGNGANGANLTALFENLSEGLLCDRTVRSYPDLPVSSIGKTGISPPLQGLVGLRGSLGKVVVSNGTRVIGGITRKVILIGLDLSSSPTATLLDYAGACGHRPSAATCNKPALTEINQVKPDCNGNIDLVFLGDVVVGDAGDGLILDNPVGMAQVCVPKPYKVIDNNDCSSSSSATPPPESSSSSPSPPPESSSSGLAGPYCEDFTGPHTELTDKSGTFTLQTIKRFQPPYELTLKRLVSSGTVQEEFTLDMLRIPDVAAGYNLRALIRPRSGHFEGHVIFGYVPPSGGGPSKNFFFGGVMLSHPSYPFGCFFLGRRVNSAVPGADSLSLGDPGSNYVFLDSGSVYAVPESLRLRETDYNFILNIEKVGGFVVVYWSIFWKTDTGLQFVGPLSYAIPIIPSIWTANNSRGYAGLGTLGTLAEFDNFGINCGDVFPPESSSSLSA